MRATATVRDIWEMLVSGAQGAVNGLRGRFSFVRCRSRTAAMGGGDPARCTPEVR
jgi:hypothetical protein